MGGACSTYCGDDKYRTLSENVNGRDHLENLKAGEKVILKWILKIEICV
jgi:hypothetical protein